MSFFLEVVQSAFSPMVLFYMFAGVAAGICIGALPYGTGVPGPGLWPGIIAALLLICSVGLIVVTLMMKKDQFPELPMWTPGTKRVYISMAILLVYMLVLSTLGFIIPSVIMLFAFCQWFHKGAFWKNALISVIVVLAIYFIFKNFLNVPIDFGMFSI